MKTSETTPKDPTKRNKYRKRMKGKTSYKALRALRRKSGTESMIRRLAERILARRQRLSWLGV